VALASLGAVALNALFHNASILTFQEETLVLLFFYLSVVRARERTASASMVPRRLRPMRGRHVRSIA
jgi:hypothetical protein